MLEEVDIVLTTYGTAASDISKSNVLSRIFWLRVILDEGMASCPSFANTDN